MMKRILACIIAIACLLTAVAALADGDMRVIKVKQAVNMRQQTNTDSAVVAQVPLGTVLSGCTKVEGTDWYQVTYEGATGYIREDFLESVGGQSAPAETQSEPAPAEPVEAAPAEPAAAPAEQAPASSIDAQPSEIVLPPEIDRPIQSINDASSYSDDYIILDTTLKGVRVVARQIFRENNEYMMVVGMDASGKVIWVQETLTGDITELMQTDCFVGGTSQSPLVLIYNAWTGLMAFDPATGENVWTILKEDLELGASISYVTEPNSGVTCVGGYYGPDPVAINPDGTILWKSTSGDAQASWMFAMELRKEGVAAHYSQLGEGVSGWVVYSYSDGSVKDVIND